MRTASASLALLVLLASRASAQAPEPDAPASDVPDLLPPSVPRAAWSEVTGQQASIAAKDRLATVIRSVDGRYASGARVQIDPGERDIVVRSPPRHGFGGTELHFRLKAEPCRRYYVNARFRLPTGTAWTPVIAKSEPIPGCRR